MEIKFSFHEPDSYWHALGCARLLCDIQHICLFALYLADESITDEFDVLNPYSQKYESMILADVYGEEKLDFYALRLRRFSFHSPPEISFGVGHTASSSKLKAILDIFKKIIFFEAQQKKQHAEAELARQRAIGEALKNFEHALNIAKKIKDPQIRRAFEDNLITSIKPFADGRHPALRNIDVD